MKGRNRSLEYRAEFKSSYENADLEVTNAIASIEKELEINKEYSFVLDFVLRELINNAIEHGNGLENDKSVKLVIDISNNKINIEVFDNGEGFDLNEIMRYINDKDISRTRGRGLLSIINLGFKLKTAKGMIKCVGDLNQNNFNIGKGGI
jgi:anti-sigma regulatory factor (Ser/Thr protein kinase)